MWCVIHFNTFYSHCFSVACIHLNCSQITQTDSKNRIQNELFHVLAFTINYQMHWTVTLTLNTYSVYIKDAVDNIFLDIIFIFKRIPKYVSNRIKEAFITFTLLIQGKMHKTFLKFIARFKNILKVYVIHIQWHLELTELNWYKWLTDWLINWLADWLTCFN